MIGPAGKSYSPSWKPSEARWGRFIWTNTVLLQRGINEQAANAVLIKLNQIGSVSEH